MCVLSLKQPEPQSKDLGVYPQDMRSVERQWLSEAVPRPSLDRQAGSPLLLPNGRALSKRYFHPNWVLRLRLG